jgi:hypothetical protein
MEAQGSGRHPSAAGARGRGLLRVVDLPVHGLLVHGLIVVLIVVVVDDVLAGSDVGHAVAVARGGDVVGSHLLAERVGGRVAAEPGVEVAAGLDEVLGKLAELWTNKQDEKEEKRKKKEDGRTWSSSMPMPSARSEARRSSPGM